MSLENLLGTSLETIEADSIHTTKLLNAAARNIKDARVEAISNENRFDAAYKAILQLANAALQANGYRTLTSKPGHHITMIQVLPKATGLDNETVIVLDGLRKQRIVADYAGDFVSESTMQDCIDHAEKLYAFVNRWFEENHSKLFQK